MGQDHGARHPQAHLPLRDPPRDARLPARGQGRRRLPVPQPPPPRARGALPAPLDAENVGEGAVCLVHPTVGPTQGDDISGEVRYQTYEVLKEELGNPNVNWAYLPYSMHMAGPREAIQHMIIRKNYGATHFIIGRDMAGSKSCL